MSETQNDNPYASPSAIEAALPEPPIVLARRRPLSMSIAGLGYGLVVGGVAGAATSGAIGFIAGVVNRLTLELGDADFPPWLTMGPVDGLIGGIMAGGFVGGFMGCVVGSITGLVGGVAKPLKRKLIVRLAGILAAIVGAAFGGVAGNLAWSHGNGPLPDWTVGAAAGAIFASAAGLVGGSFLGRRIYAAALEHRA